MLYWRKPDTVVLCCLLQLIASLSGICHLQVSAETICTLEDPKGKHSLPLPTAEINTPVVNKRILGTGV